MFTKRQAKTFFLGGTAVFFLIFLVFTYDSLTNGIPRNTHPEGITPQVELGRQLWDKNNCMGCHTLMGEGAYYAPELTRVYSRRGPDYIKAALNAPNGWAPRGRHMVEYHFTPEETEALVSFFKWIDKAYLNGFPPKPNLKQ